MKRNVSSGTAGAVFGVFIALMYVVLQLVNGSFEVKQTLLTALLTGAVAGALFGLYIRSFSKRQAAEFSSVRQRLESEGTVYLDDAANHYYNGGYVGGRMYLTDTGLYFLANPMNVLSHNVKLSYAEIAGVETLKDMGFASGIVISTVGGGKEYFAVTHHKKWMEEIMNKKEEV